jgi:hypothetical protein
MSEGTDKHVEDQAKEQTGQQQIRLQIDESKMLSAYANAFRTNGTAEEVVVDFGLNLMNPTGQQGGPLPMVFQLNQRVILNYYSAKRLALTLGQIIHRHEEQFGMIELDVAKRQAQK